MSILQYGNQTTSGKYDPNYNPYGGIYGRNQTVDPGTAWNPMGSTDNVWNNSTSDGSIPWDVQMQIAQRMGTLQTDGNGNYAMPSIYGTSGGDGGSGGSGGSGASGMIPSLNGARGDWAADTANDPYINSALGHLKGITSGQNLPFDATTKANMLSGASDMAAAAEASNAGDIAARAAASGASMNDPATQAALAHLKSQRQQGNMQAAQGIESQANQANFAARSQAANQMGGMRLEQARVDPNLNGAAKQIGTGSTFNSGLPTYRPVTGGGGPVPTTTQTPAQANGAYNPATGTGGWTGSGVVTGQNYADIQKARMNNPGYGIRIG